MSTFTLPTLNEDPAYFDSNPPPEVPRAGNMLMRFYSARPAGAAVFKMSNGQYYINRQIAGLTGPVVIEAWPSIPLGPTSDGTPCVPNQAINQSWNGYTPGEMIQESQNPYVLITYLGGRSYEVSASEAADLTAAGFGAYIT